MPYPFDDTQQLVPFEDVLNDMYESLLARQQIIIGRFKSAAAAVVSRTPSTAWTQIAWPGDYLAKGAGVLSWDAATNEAVNLSTNSIIVGVDASIGWDSAAAGARWMSLRKTLDGVQSFFGSDVQQTGNTGLVVNRTRLSGLIMEPGARLAVVGAQNSGASLNIVASLTSAGGPVNFFQVEYKGLL